jgi:hypothetical protein
MLGRLFWFILGVSVATWVFLRIRQMLRQASPDAVTQRLAASATGVSASARDFTDRVRAAMAEREAEIRDELGLDQ